jgi:hypothetical protein
VTPPATSGGNNLTWLGKKSSPDRELSIQWVERTAPYAWDLAAGITVLFQARALTFQYPKPRYMRVRPIRSKFKLELFHRIINGLKMQCS